MSPVTFVSLGPGDPELITCKGLRALQEADFIFYPSSRYPEKAGHIRRTPYPF